MVFPGSFQIFKRFGLCISRSFPLACRCWLVSDLVDFSGCGSSGGCQVLILIFHLGDDPFGFLVQGTTVRVEFGDATTSADPTDALTISRAFPNTYGHPLAHFLRATAKVPDAQIITEFPPIRSVSAYHVSVSWALF